MRNDEIKDYLRIITTYFDIIIISTKGNEGLGQVLVGLPNYLGKIIDESMNALCNRCQLSRIRNYKSTVFENQTKKSQHLNFCSKSEQNRQNYNCRFRSTLKCDFLVDFHTLCLYISFEPEINFCYRKRELFYLHCARK